MLTSRLMNANIRFGVVGLGHIAQVAMLPAFKNAKNAELTALVSGDPVKLDELGKKYEVTELYAYDQYDELLRSGKIDAVYIALPNTMHRTYAERALKAGVHVLCEKPMATSAEDCLAMIEAASDHGTKLMVAYRLHFDRGNLEAMEVAQSGEIGDLRFFSSTFSMQVTDPDNIRLNRELGGGPMWDIGIYCINAARMLFRSEPIEVTAISGNSGEPRFAEIEEMTEVLMRFPGERLASFSCSFGGADSNYYEVVGTEGSLCLEQAYEYAGDMRLDVWVGEKHRSKKFAKHDQFGAELTYFADCIFNDTPVEPCGREGLADVRVIQAILESARTGVTVPVEAVYKPVYAEADQVITKPAIREPKTVHVTSPTA